MFKLRDRSCGQIVGQIGGFRLSGKCILGLRYSTRGDVLTFSIRTIGTISMRKAIVAIGGGEIRTRGTAPIDREIIRLSGKKNPKLLFIPTASSDSERYWKHV
jgi:hypothetical protein